MPEFAKDKTGFLCPFFVKATSKERLIKFDNLKRMAHIDDEIKDPRVEELPDVRLVTKSFVFF